MKKSFALMVMLLLVAGFSSAAMAFHDTGVASCGGCHTMHNTQGGQPVDGSSGSGNPYLLRRSTPSDTCLSCHADYGQRSADGQTLGPGGDFYWLTRDISSDSTDDPASDIIYGREHGHNINAPANGIQPDPALTTAPGGSFNCQYLGCNSCHDPHTNNNFRMLYGVGETEANYPGGYNFANPAPVAAGRSQKTKIADAGAEKIGQHTAYIGGISDWCINCHTDLRSGVMSRLTHPTNRSVGAALSRNYNAYVTTGNNTGAFATAYLPLVPFEDSGNSTTSTTGTTSASKVMCLTCHRAHASPYRHAGRWDFGQTGLSESKPANEPYLAQYLGDPLDMTTQRNLCNKCHSKDSLALRLAK